jgi:transcriptional regulator with XRE-family HTH domain
MAITGVQLRAGRALAGLSATEMCQAAGVSKVTLWRVEGGKDTHVSTLGRIVSALHRHHVVFTVRGVELSERPRVGELARADDRERNYIAAAI